MINKIDNIIKSLSFEFPYTSTEWAETMLLENYHSHSSFSNVSTPDSPTNMGKYAERIKELGAKCLYSGEHGSQGNHMEVYTIAEASGLKYVHSTEAYWVKDRHEKDNMNCHICIIGLNSEARRELNYILSIANEDGYYYKPRIDLELILSLNPADFIVTSACVAGWSYDDADDVWLKIAGHFKENFFFEVQPHHTDKQKALNKHILELSGKYNIDIICGLDSHYIESDGSIKRDKILEYKNISYPEEEGWFMDYPDGKTVYTATVGDLTPEFVAAYYEWQGYVTKLAQVAITDLEATVEVEKQMKAFEKKYMAAPDDTTGYGDVLKNKAGRTAKVSAAHKYYTSVNFDKEYDAIKDLKSTEYVANKDKIVKLAQAIVAYEDKYALHQNSQIDYHEI